MIVEPVIDRYPVLGRRKSSNIEDWKRVKALRRELITTVPRFPNDKTSLRAMQATATRCGGFVT